MNFMTRGSGPGARAQTKPEPSVPVRMKAGGGLSRIHSRLMYTTLVVGMAAVVASFGVLTTASSTAAATKSQGTSSASHATGSSVQNLLTPAQAQFNGTTGGWQPVNATLSPAQGSTSGSSALEVTATATAWVSAWSALPPAGTPAVATPGDKYIGDASVEASSSGESLGDGIAFYNSAGTQLTAVFGQAVTPTSGTWDTLPEVEAIAPATTAYVIFGVLSWAPVVGQDFLIESPSLYTLTTPAVAPSVVGPLHTSGNQIVQANGQSIMLRGVVMPGLQISSTMSGTGASEQTVIEAKDWGANFVRVPLSEEYWLTSNCDYNPTYQATVDQVVNWITSLGMVALLDLHTNSVSSCETGTPSQHNMADEAQSPTFWSQVAARYGNPSRLSTTRSSPSTSTTSRKASPSRSG